MEYIAHTPVDHIQVTPDAVQLINLITESVSEIAFGVCPSSQCSSGINKR